MQNDPKNDLIDAVKKVISKEIGQSKKLDQVKNQIAACQKEGYTHAKIVEFLEEGGLIIKKQVFSNYLSRRAKKSPAKKMSTAQMNELQNQSKPSSGFDISKNELSKYS
jgi:ATP-dependent 26S proteasome regulatory subunit